MNFSDLTLSGQFDDADDLGSEIILNLATVENNNNDEKGDYIDEVDDPYDDYYDKFNMDETAKGNISLHHFEDKMDFSSRSKLSSKKKDKGDNATVDRVLDKRSMNIMYKMMLHNEFTKVNGCISAGKEANVYHAPTCTGEDLVIKVYMTAIMPFKSREKYMKGDNRFKNVSQGSSTRLINAWAEKEFRNLNRLYQTNGAVPCPRPIKQVGMVVLMSMIGDEGVGAPRIKDANVESDEEWSAMYRQVVAYLRIMYKVCHLVHADLSEYNLLYHHKKVYVIDVGQSVEHEHPNAFVFLRKDCHIINSFFRRHNISTLSLRELFFFVIDISECKPEEEDFYPSIDRLIRDSTFAHDDADDSFFLDVKIDQYLADIQGERIHDQYRQIVKDPQYVDSLLFAKVAGIDQELKNIRSTKISNIKKHKRTLRDKKNMLKNGLDSDKDSDVEEKEEDNMEERKEDSNICEEKKVIETAFCRPKNEDLESKKERKKQVKEAQKEARVRNKKALLDEKFRTVSGFKYKNTMAQ